MNYFNKYINNFIRKSTVKMGKKEQGLLTGSIAFTGLYIVAAIIIGQYVFYTTKDRTAASYNRKYEY